MTHKLFQREAAIGEVLRKMDCYAGEKFEESHLSGDGSDRDFYRVVLPKGDKFLFAFPSPSNPKAMLEASSCFRIGSHLENCGVPVPHIYHFDEARGVVVYEYLGEDLLHDIFCQDRKVGFQDRPFRLSPLLRRLYEKAIDALVRLQVFGARGFKSSYCWESSSYSKALMLERESGYFLESYCRNYRGIDIYPEGLQGEFVALADRVAEEDHSYLMHRDFQSRNIMVRDGEICIIDFQGARCGPLGYDLASLINDPYVHMAEDDRILLLNYYVDSIKKHIFLDRDTFIKGYYHIALQRNLQILGAFSFLSKVRGKLFFKPYIRPALSDLAVRLQGSLKNTYPVLSEFVRVLTTLKHE